MNEATQKQISEIQKTDAKLITVLLCNAKCLQALRKHTLAGASDLVLAKQLDGLMHSIVQLYKADGVQLEADALALAGRLGFAVEHIYTAKGSEVPQ